MTAETLSRAARPLALPQIGTAARRRMHGGTALLIGVGGIGCAAATCLAASGLGHLTVSDFDRVDETNPGRQVPYGADNVGERKVGVAAATEFRQLLTRKRVDCTACAQSR